MKVLWTFMVAANGVDKLEEPEGYNIIDIGTFVILAKKY